jgi:DNA-binding CsgD family transcriptional regulator
VIAKRLTDNGLSLAADFVGLSAKLMASLHGEDALDVLGETLKDICPSDDFIVMLHRPDARPSILATNLGMDWLANRISGYLDGLYVLDPYYQKTVSGESGFFRLSDISPEEYFESEYFNHFYKHTNIVDETRFVVSLDTGLSIQALVARAGDSPKFQDLEIEMLAVMHPLIEAFCRAHFAFAGPRYLDLPHRADTFDLRDRIASMPGSQLTAREIDTIELMLKGHSTKSLARILNIDDGTVSNHKRNVYQKLNIHSQAQLFSLFLQSLTEG